MEGKNKIVLITTDDKLSEVKAKLLEKGYKNMSVNPSKIEDAEVAIITRTGVAETHPNAVVDVEAIPTKEESKNDDGVKIKQSGKELPTTEQSKENVANAAVEPPNQGKEEQNARESVKQASINKIDETDDEAEKRFAHMSRSKGFGF